MIDALSTTATVVGATQGIVELAKTAIQLAKKEKNANELIDLIQDIREKAQEIREENLDLRNKILELEKKIDTNSQLEFDHNNLLWVNLDEKKDGPYCSQCKDNHDKMVRLHNISAGSRGRFHQCPTCNTKPDIHSLKDPQINTRRGRH